MAVKGQEHLSRRERQIMDIIYRKGEGTVADVLENLSDSPSYSTVRALMGILEGKGHLRHRKDGPRYVYEPTRPQREAAQSALRRVLETFFNGSAEKAVAALLDGSEKELTPAELERLAKLIERAKKEGE